MKQLIFSCLFLWSTVTAFSQGSPDSRVCNCFVKPVANDFLAATRAAYGTIALTLSTDIEIRPAHGEAVKFTLPVLGSKAGCQSWYSLYVADSLGNKVYEVTGQSNVISYSFPECGKRYEITMMAYSRSEAGGDGNCSRRLRFKVRPVCRTTACNCAPQKGKAAASADFSLAGKLECLVPTLSNRRYSLQLDIINKTDCILNIQSITVHGQTLTVPAYNTPAKGQTRGVVLPFNSPRNLSAPADSKVTLVVRYTLNGRKCSTVQEMIYQPCK